MNCNTLLHTFLYCIWVGSIDVSGHPRAGPQSGVRPPSPHLCQQSVSSTDRALFYFGVSERACLVDGAQVGRYLDNVFGFRAELGLKIGLGGAPEAGFRVAGSGLRWSLGLARRSPCPLASGGLMSEHTSPSPNAASSGKPSRPPGRRKPPCPPSCQPSCLSLP